MAHVLVCQAEDREAEVPPFRLTGIHSPGTLGVIASLCLKGLTEALVPPHAVRL